MTDAIGSRLRLSAVLRLYRRPATLHEALLRGIFASGKIWKVGILDVSRLEKRVMIVRCRRITTVEHRIFHDRRLEFHEPWLTCPVIARHGEELTRFGLEAVLELACKRFSSKICRVECVVDYERGARVWERLKVVVSYGRQIDGVGGEIVKTKKY
jgi:hypothetical protein